MSEPLLDYGWDADAQNPFAALHLDHRDLFADDQQQRHKLIEARVVTGVAISDNLASDPSHPSNDEKRAIIGVWHWISDKHLGRYLAETTSTGIGVTLSKAGSQPCLVHSMARCRSRDYWHEAQEIVSGRPSAANDERG